MLKLKQLKFVLESNIDYGREWTLVPYMFDIREGKATSSVRPVLNASFFFASRFCRNAIFDPGPNMNPNVAFVVDIQSLSSKSN